MDRIQVEIAYASQDRHIVLALELHAGASVLEAIQEAGLLANFPEIDLTTNKVGIFGNIVALETILQNADRVEIYRPLVCDPKELRRRRVSEQKSRT